MSSKLKRELGLLECTLAGVGIIIGAGIYTLIGKATAIAGNGVWLSFVLAAVAAVFTGLSYAELSSTYAKSSSGEFTYASKAFGKRTAFTTGWLVLFAGIVGSAAVALGFAGYFAALTNLPVVPVAIALVLLSSVISYVGIKQSTGIADAITVLEVLGLVAIILLGAGLVSHVDFTHIGEFPNVLNAASLLFFAFIGFEGIIKLSEETRAPEKTIPTALLLSIAITAVLYILTAVSALSILGSQALGASTAPIAEVAAKALHANSAQAFAVLGIIALFSTANTVLLLLVTTSRLFYGMAKEGGLPKLLAAVHSRRQTPHLAILLTAVATIAFVLLGNIEFAARLTDFAVFAVFIAVNLAAIILRVKNPNLHRPFKMPFAINNVPITAVLGVLTCAALSLSLGLEIIAGGLIVTLIGLGITALPKKN